VIWVLKQSDANQAPLTFRLTRGSVRTLGRAVRADFVVDASLVSRLHCRFTVREDDALVVEDLGSTNGTFVNGRKVREAQLDSGDELGIGRVTLRVERG
jgi:pSer/pThr/pTyr-binding forkhead associated (FHA) protein